MREIGENGTPRPSRSRPLGVLSGSSPYSVLVALALLLAACSSLSSGVRDIAANIPPALRFKSVYRDVDALLGKNDFRGAREKLDQAGVGTTPTAESLKDNDRAAARRLFEERVTARFLSENQQLLSQGKPRLAADKLAEASTLCPWCAGLQQAKTVTAGTLSSIDALAAKLKDVLAMAATKPSDLTAHRSVIASAQQHRAMLNDSAAIQTDLESVEMTIIKVWESRVKSAEFGPSDLGQFHDDLALLGLSRQVQDHLETQLQLSTTEQSRVVNEPSHREALLRLLRSGAPTYPRSVLQLRQIVAARFGPHLLGALRQQLLSPQVDYSAVEFSEELLAAARDRGQSLRQLVARGHIARAEHLAGSGRSAALALVHLERALQLGVESTDPNVTKLRDLASASLASAGRIPIRLRVRTNPSDVPIVQDLASFAVSRSIVQNARPHVQILAVSQYAKEADIQISIDSATLFVPSLSDLKVVVSTYLSHYEDVPNPAKSALKTRLNFQRISVDSALSSLNSAISSFNIYPSQWALQAVNNARTQYNMEIDTYNYIVQQYNVTSSTIPRAVYLPYSFTEGTVRHGWHLAGSIKVGEAEKRFRIDEIDSDFVRLGTRPEDRDASRRRDDLLDIPVGTERLVAQLVKAADRVRDTVGKLARALRIDVKADLSEPERKLVAATLYPFGETSSRSGTVASWADEAIRKIALPLIQERTIPPVRIVLPRARPRDTTPEEIASFYAPAVALISSKDGTIGSGALISNPDFHGWEFR